MASSGLAVAEAGVGVEDYNFTDDFDMGEVEYGVDENVLDLSEAEAEGFGPGSAIAASGIPAASTDDFDYDSADMGEMATLEDEVGPDDFELDLTESTAGQAYVSDDAAPMDTAMPDIAPEHEPEVSLDVSPEGGAEPEVDAALDPDFGGSGFDSEVEGLGFGFDETPGEKAPEPEAAAEEISLDVEPEAEAEISLEPELELTDDEPENEEPSLELPEDEDEGISLELPEDEDEGVSLELSEEPELEMGDMDGEEIVLSDEDDYETPVEDLVEEEEEEDAGGIDFDLDSVDLDAPEEEASLDEEPEAVDTGDEPSLEVEGLELEMESPDEPEEEENP